MPFFASVPTQSILIKRDPQPFVELGSQQGAGSVDSPFSLFFFFLFFDNFLSNINHSNLLASLAVPLEILSKDDLNLDSHQSQMMSLVFIALWGPGFHRRQCRCPKTFGNRWRSDQNQNKPDLSHPGSKDNNCKVRRLLPHREVMGDERGYTGFVGFFSRQGVVPFPENLELSPPKSESIKVHGFRFFQAIVLLKSQALTNFFDRQPRTCCFGPRRLGVLEPPRRRRQLDPVHGFLGLQLLAPGFGEALDAGGQAALDAVLVRLGVGSLTVGAHGPPAPPALCFVQHGPHGSSVLCVTYVHLFHDDVEDDHMCSPFFAPSDFSFFFSALPTLFLLFFTA